MDFYLNELSVRNLASSERIARKWVSEFAGICNRLKNEYRLGKVFVNNTFYSDELYSEFPMGKLLSDKEVKSRMKNLRLIFFQIEYPDGYNPHDYVIDDTIAFGLGLAFFTNSFGLSFISEEKWEEKNILFENKKSVRNISSTEHLKIHKAALDKKLSKCLRIPDNYNFVLNPLPFANKSNEKFNIKAEFERVKGLSRDDKRAEYKLLGTKIAEFNQWKYDKTVSKLNQNKGQLRTIFRIGEGTKTYYLSIDYENGPFELFKRERGGKEAEHLGEYSSITGKKNHGHKKHDSLKLKR